MKKKKSWIAVNNNSRIP